jgi:predicted acylesterase/phospholipase RssA
MENNRPKIGIALSGGAGRAAAHFGVIDVLLENNISPDIIVGCSSGALVAVSYGAGTRDYLFEQFKTMTQRRLWDYTSWRGARGGLFHLHKADPELKKLSGGKSLEDLRYKIGITAADIQTGHLVTITKGDIVQAIRASVAIPGLFAPEIIDNRILLEGGLVNIVPTIPTKQLGADIVIGVDVAKAKFFYQKKMPLFRFIRVFRRILGIDFIQHGIIGPITSQIMDRAEKQLGIKKRYMPNAIRIFSWAVDRSYDVEEEWKEENRTCDIMIQPDVKDTDKLEMTRAQYIYDQGRAAALAALPKIKELIRQFEENKIKT